MDKNKIIILALVIVIAILAVGLFSMVHNAKQDTKIIIDGNSTVHQGDTIDLILKDSNNASISNKTLNVTVGGNNELNNYLINTDDHGIAKLKINESEGNYTINCTFSGDDKYNANASSKNISVEILQAVVSSVSSDSSSSTVSSEPECGSDSYVDKWDESQKSGSDWAYLHDQPVKSEGGHEYKRMYDEDTGKGYWYQMDRNTDE